MLPIKYLASKINIYMDIYYFEGPLLTPHAIYSTGHAVVLSDFRVHLLVSLANCNSSSPYILNSTHVANLISGFAAGAGIQKTSVMCTGIITERYDLRTGHIHEDNPANTILYFSPQTITDIRLALQNLLDEDVILEVEHMGNRDAILRMTEGGQWGNQNMMTSNNVTGQVHMSEVVQANKSFLERKVLKRILIMGITTIINKVC